MTADPRFRECMNSAFEGEQTKAVSSPAERVKRGREKCVRLYANGGLDTYLKTRPPVALYAKVKAVWSKVPEKFSDDEKDKWIGLKLSEILTPDETDWIRAQSDATNQYILGHIPPSFLEKDWDNCNSPHSRSL